MCKCLSDNVLSALAGKSLLALSSRHLVPQALETPPERRWREPGQGSDLETSSHRAEVCACQHTDVQWRIRWVAPCRLTDELVNAWDKPKPLPLGMGAIVSHSLQFQTDRKPSSFSGLPVEYVGQRGSASVRNEGPPVPSCTTALHCAAPTSLYVGRRVEEVLTSLVIWCSLPLQCCPGDTLLFRLPPLAWIGSCPIRTDICEVHQKHWTWRR